MGTRAIGRATRILAIGLAGVAMAAMPACIAIIGFDGPATYERYEYVEVERTGTLTPAADARVLLDVETRNGSIGVQRHDGAGVEVLARFKTLDEDRAAGVGLDLSHDSKTGTLRVRPIWPGGKPMRARGGSEGVSFEIRVPRADGVTLVTKNGALKVASLAGEARLTTSNGSIEVEHHAGPVLASTSNGRIELSEIGGDVRAKTSNGAIEIEGVHGTVTAETSNGRIEAELGSGAAGPVDLRTSNGSVELTVGSAFAGSIEYGLSLGSVTLHGFPDGAVERHGKRSGVIRLGDGPTSTVRTSLGSLSIEREG